MEYREHVGKFVESAAMVDYFLTVIILHRFVTNFQDSDVETGEEFLNYFVRDTDHGMDFGRKRTLFIKICEKHYAEQLTKYPNLTKENFKLIGEHRNMLAHSFRNPVDNKDERVKYFVLTSLNPNWADNKGKLYFNKCTDMETVVLKVLVDIQNLYKDLELI